MSRVGKKPVAIPSGVSASVEGQVVKVKGPKGTLALALHGDVAAKVEGNEVKVDPRTDTKRARAMWGTYRSLLANVITGVTKGFERRLEVTGEAFLVAPGAAAPKVADDGTLVFGYGEISAPTRLVAVIGLIT